MPNNTCPFTKMACQRPQPRPDHHIPLRDYLAGQYMSGRLAAGTQVSKINWERFSVAAYKAADAFLATREIPPDELAAKKSDD